MDELRRHMRRFYGVAKSDNSRDENLRRIVDFIRQSDARVVNCAARRQSVPKWSVPRDKLDKYLKKLGPVYHNVGRSIIMPSGSGKSYWMKNLQHTNHKDWDAIAKQSFIDSDPLMIAVGAMPPLNGKDLSGGLSWDSDMEQICKRCDKVMVECKKKGLWIMGASWWDAEIIDSFVVLPAELNKKYLKGKQKKGEGFDDDYYEKEVLPYIKNKIIPAAKKNKIPIFNNIESCASYIIQVD